MPIMSAFTRTQAWKQLASSFRKSFEFPGNAAVNWFPGHMTKGLRMMEKTLYETDLVIEVHDGRIPLSGRYVRFSGHITGNRPHLLVLNKKDLALPPDKKESEDVQKKFRQVILDSDSSLSDVIFTNCKDIHCTGLKKVLPTAIDLLKKSDRYHRAANPDSNILIVGVPNVGKSSLINLVRSKSLKIGGKVAKVGGIPGITRAVQTKIRVNDDPLVYLLDSPGVLMPNIKDLHVAMKLALCGCVKDSEVGEELIADYLLFKLNRANRFEYVNYMKLEAPIDNIRQMLAKAAIHHGFFINIKDFEKGGHRNVPDLVRTAKYFLSGFRTGLLGYFNLDADMLKSS